jgi:hypothetical protein
VRGWGEKGVVSCPEDRINEQPKDEWLVSGDRVSPYKCPKMSFPN